MFLENKGHINNELLDPIPLKSEIRQGDGLSPILFNLIMDQIIQGTKTAGKGLTKAEIKPVSYADDAVLTAEGEDDLQRMLCASQKTKSIVIAKEPTKYKLCVNNNTIQQMISLKYLGIEFSSYNNL